ncbi:hypothetical protein DEO72_LG8g755 [Vigna unguiculata]|uniref:Uncharacterized protein n=1 Tax=Vigna unguiculata TaxID=3917 RepID=A0A4D6MMF0_VIGUN|nr:hypothetical protein DEO72_LG8g755 [Vigna unguiculata]
MDDEACDHLQSLWDEVKIFEFDLDWLECDVAFALGVKEKAAKVKKAKEDVDGLEIKIEILKTEVERARKELVQAKEEFEEHTQDHKLGYGGSTCTFIS